MPTILITGAANGLGAAFLSVYQKDTKNSIIAIDRDQIDLSSDRLQSFVVDIASQESVNILAHKIEHREIDIVIHSAGIRGLVPEAERQNPDNVAACETVNVMDYETLMRTFEINAVGTFMFIRALLPNLRKAGGKVIVMSSRMGSIGNNQHPNKDAGRAYAYRASKAALNTIVRSFAADVPEITFVLCHPGRVETKLVKSKEEGAITTEESVTSFITLIREWNHNDSGKFYDRFGQPIQW